jgi:hypothetical protein
VAAFSGVHDLRSYLELHEHLGEPAVRKIARQLLKCAPFLAFSFLACSWKMFSATVHMNVMYDAAILFLQALLAMNVLPSSLHASHV